MTSHGASESPELREGRPIGTIAVGRAHAGRFSDRQIDLLKTFADQAVIAIENVRLFKELEARNRELTETLEQQTTTGEILRVISSSPTDVQPVFDTIAQSAARICAAAAAHIWQREGDRLRVVASLGALPPTRRELTISRQSVVGRAVNDRRAVHVEDLAEAFHEEFPDSWGMKSLGYRTILAMPLVREGEPIGVIMIRRTEVRPFSSGQVALLKTFADQAVIAIENVRLFQELRTRTRDLMQSVGELRALGEVSQAVGSNTCVGDVVNVAAHLEAHTKVVGQPILIDDNTRNGLADGIRVEAHAAAQFKTSSNTVPVYSVPSGQRP